MVVEGVNEGVGRWTDSRLPLGGYLDLISTVIQAKWRLLTGVPNRDHVSGPRYDDLSSIVVVLVKGVTQSIMDLGVRGGTLPG